MREVRANRMVNEEGKPFQGLEEKIFARYISDMLSRYAEVSDITAEAWPELVGEIKLLRLSVGRVASALEKIATTKYEAPGIPGTVEQPAAACGSPTIISLDIRDDLKVALALRDTLFQAALRIEDDISDTLEDPGESISVIPETTLEDRRAMHIAKRYPKSVRARVSEIFNEFYALNAQEEEPLTKYLDIKKKYPKVVYYLYGRARIWSGTAAFLAAYNEWCNQ